MSPRCLGEQSIKVSGKEVLRLGIHCPSDVFHQANGKQFEVVVKKDTAISDTTSGFDRVLRQLLHEFIIIYLAIIYLAIIQKVYFIRIESL